MAWSPAAAPVATCTLIVRALGAQTRKVVPPAESVAPRWSVHSPPGGGRDPSSAAADASRGARELGDVVVGPADG